MSMYIFVSLEYLLIPECIHVCVVCITISVRSGLTCGPFCGNPVNWCPDRFLCKIIAIKKSQKK